MHEPPIVRFIKEDLHASITAVHYVSKQSWRMDSSSTWHAERRSQSAPTWNPRNPQQNRRLRIQYAVIHTLTNRQDVEDNNPMTIGAGRGLTAARPVSDPGLSRV